MRYLFGFLCVCALGLMPLVGCSEGECQNAEDCDDQNACTDDHCEFVTGDCIYSPVYDGQACDFDGLAGVCIDGVCGEDFCKGDPCEDGNECTTDDCNSASASCSHWTWPRNGIPCDWDGVPGICVDGVCGEDFCKGVVCDDGLDCTSDACDYRDGTCVHPDLCYRESDHNSCTDDTCDPETGECIHTPVPDGQGCCARWGPCSGWCICIPGPCPDECVEPGLCQNGECVPD